MRTPLGSLALLALLPALAALPQPARANVIVDYSFDTATTTLNVTSPVVLSIPPQGTLSGEADVTYSTDAQGNIANGPATLDLLNLQANLNISTTFDSLPVTLTGPAAADLEEPVAGTLSGGTQLSFNGANGTFHGFGTITCVGVVCSAIGLTSGVAKAFDGSAAVPLPTLTVGSLHGSIAGITFQFGSLDVIATLNFNATETGRTLPEPALLTLGGVSLALLALARRRSS